MKHSHSFLKYYMKTAQSGQHIGLIGTLKCCGYNNNNDNDNDDKNKTTHIALIQSRSKRFSLMTF